MDLTEAQLQTANDLGREFAKAQKQSGQTSPDDLSVWSDIEDLPPISEVYERVTGRCYPEVLTDELGATLDRLADEFADGYTDIFEMDLTRA